MTAMLENAAPSVATPATTHKTWCDTSKEYQLRAIENYEAPNNYLLTTTVVTFEITLLDIQQSKRGNKKCKLLLHRLVRARCAASGMW